MVLTDEQVDRFFDTMDALMYYVNEKFRVVKGFSLESETQLDDVKAAMVAHELWSNVEVIDDFVRENPYSLPQRCLDVASAWKNALPGFYTLVRYQAGRALLMNDVGVFSVCGVTNELEGEIGPAPAGVEMVLLPFDDVIVYDGFLQAYDLSGFEAQDEMRRIQDEFEARCAGGIVATAAEFAQRAGAHLAAERDRELDELLADVSRDAAGVGDAGEEAGPPPGFHRGALAGLSGIERERAIEEHFAYRAAGVQDAGASAAGASEPVGAEAVRERRRKNQALACANACAVIHGIAAVDDVYAQYRALCADVMDESEFRAFLAAEADRAEAAAFDLWAYRDVEHLAHFTLGNDYLVRDFMRSHSGAPKGVFLNRESGEIASALPGSMSTGDFAGAGASGSMRGDLLIELGHLEQYRRDLVDMRDGQLPMKPLSRRVLEQDVIGILLADPSAIALRDFLDERVPDGEDDYSFADRVVEEIVFSSIEVGSLDDLFAYVMDLGLEGCSANGERLPLLVTNVYNSMPSWENNGWSPQELYEQMTGRKMFYNPDGSVMRVGPDDLCPCGSGKKYRDCCGGE